MTTPEGGKQTYSEKRKPFGLATILLVLVLLGISVFLRIPWLGTEHYASGDEVLWGLVAKNVFVHPLLFLNPSHTQTLPDEITSDTRYPLFVRSSAYPALIAVPVGIFGPDHFTLRIVHCLFGIALVLLIFWVGRLTLGYAQGAAAALAFATLPAAVMMSRMAYNENAVAAIGLLAAGLVFRKKRVGGAIQVTLVGLLVGYAYLIKAIEIMVIALPALVILVVTQRDRRLWRWLAVSVGVSLAVVLLPLALKLLLTPWTLDNAVKKLGFNAGVPWTKPFEFYFVYLLNEFSILLPFIGCGLLSVARKLRQAEADGRILLWPLILLMVIPMSIPQVKKDTYSLMLWPALVLLAGEGMLFAARLRGQGRAWAGAGAVLLIGLPMLALTMGWVPAPTHGNFLFMSREAVNGLWPPALWIILAVNVIVVLVAMSGRLSKRLPSAVLATGAVVAVVVLSGGVTWLGIVAGQEDLAAITRHRNRNFQCGAFVKLREEIKEIWPGRDLLVGGKVHSMDISYHSVPADRIEYVRFKSDQRMRELIDMAGNGNLFPFFADSMDVSIKEYKRKPSRIGNLSPRAAEWYKLLRDRYKDVTRWFRKRYRVDTSVRVYCLKHINLSKTFE